MSQRSAIILIISILTAGVFITGWFFLVKREFEMSSRSTGRGITPAATEDVARVQDGLTEGWKIHRDHEYGFELRYPPEWNAESHSILDVGELVTLTNAEDKGDISVSILRAAPILFRQLCPGSLGLAVEPLRLNSVSWQGCLSKPEGFSNPSVYTPVPGTDKYIVLVGGTESEALVDVTRISDYEFTIIRILRTFRFLSSVR